MLTSRIATTFFVIVGGSSPSSERLRQLFRRFTSAISPSSGSCFVTLWGTWASYGAIKRLHSIVKSSFGVLHLRNVIIWTAVFANRDYLSSRFTRHGIKMFFIYNLANYILNLRQR